MSVPALRQPKIIKKAENEKPPPSSVRGNNGTQDFLIITLKDGKKLVVSSDAYHGILTAGGLYRCVFCETEMIRDMLCKERHKTSEYHRKILENYPHIDDYKENLIRKLSGSTHYCTICNVVILSNFLHKHMNTEAHTNELMMASTRAVSYKPTINADNTDEFPPLNVASK